MATSEHGLDREKQTDYDFGIEVSDSGQPPRTNTTTLHIKILDVNDNPPKFREDLYEVVLAPDVPFTGPILRVEVSGIMHFNLICYNYHFSKSLWDVM